MTPAIDLRRLNFTPTRAVVAEYGTDRLILASDQWLFSACAFDSERSNNVMHAYINGTARTPLCRQDVFEGRDGACIRRFLIKAQGRERAVQCNYVISFHDEWLVAEAYSRFPGESFDIRPVDDLVRSFQLERNPRLDVEVPPAWVTYQQHRKPGTAVGRFILFMAPAPVFLGNVQRAADTAPPTESNFNRGGRGIASDLIEFYVKDDPTSVRIDIWLEDCHEFRGRETVFDAPLQVVNNSISVRSLDKPFQVRIPSGNYHAWVTLVNQGKYADRLLTEEEWLYCDDLERYEIFLRTPSDLGWNPKGSR